MKYFFCAAAMIAFAGAQAQSIVGTWQQVEKKTCFEALMPESETEKELTPQMGGTSQNAVAKLIRFDGKGRGAEGIFSAGKKRGSNMDEFQYQITDQEHEHREKVSNRR